MTRTFFVLSLILCAVLTWAQPAVVVRNITVRGNNVITADAIRAAMQLQPGGPFATGETTVDEEAIMGLGFFQNVNILSDFVSDTEVDLIVEVSENPVVKEIRIVGNQAVTTERLTELVLQTQAIGQIYNLRNARPIQAAVEKEYTDRGYFVQIEALGPDPDSPGTLLVAVLEPTVNTIKFVGLTRTKPSTVERIMKTKPGGPFSLRTWQRDMEELFATYWFETIKPNVTPADQPGSYDLTIDFTEARTGSLTAGVALDPQSRLVGTASYSDSNFRGSGQNVGLQLSQATAGGGPSIELAYGNRFYDSRDTSMNASLYSRVQYNFVGTGLGPFQDNDRGDAFDERRTGGNVSFTRRLNDRYTATVGLQAENIKTVNLQRSSNDFNFIQQDGDLVILALGAALDTRRPSVEPWAGQFASIRVEPGYSNITKIGGTVGNVTDVLGSKTFLRTTLEYRQYWSAKLPDDTPLDQARPVLAFRAKYGIISGTVPFFEQFFVGGSDSLRGYANQRFWGSQMFLSTLEYRYPIQRSFNIIPFVDYGGAWDGYGKLRGFPQTQDPDLQFGFGVGLSFRTPIAPIRIDFAWNQQGQSRTHFSFGTSF